MTDQQESRDAVETPRATKGDPALLARRRRLELSRADVLRQLDLTLAEGHRQMLVRALAALEEQLAQLG